jgi:hypothetical protein
MVAAHVSSTRVVSTGPTSCQSHASAACTSAAADAVSTSRRPKPNGAQCTLRTCAAHTSLRARAVGGKDRIVAAAGAER